MRQPSRSERFSRFAIKGFAIPARVIWWGLSSLGETYNLLFGRWLDPWLHKRRDKEFSAELERRLGRLFARHPARPIPNSRSDYEMKRLFDYSVASFETEDLLLRFVKVRLEYSAYVSPVATPRFEDIESVLTWMDVRFRYPASWEGIGELLLEHWDTLKEGCSRSGIR